MDTRVGWRMQAVAIGLAATLWAWWTLAGPPSLEAVRGGGIVTAIGCVVCAGGGLASVFSGGSLALLLWSTQGTAVAAACLATCIAAVT
jgi:hypothetical protein